MIVLIPSALFVVAAAVAYLRGGLQRTLATAAMLLATAWSLLLTTEWRPAAGWLLPTLLATLLVVRPARGVRLTFEQITRRATTLSATGLVAVFAATKFSIGENPTVLSSVPWLLGAVAAAWLISPIDEREQLQALVLLIASGSALLLSASPGGLLTGAACGAMALLPPLAVRWPLPERAGGALRTALLLSAALLAALALIAGPLPRPALQDLALSLDGPALFGAALLLLAAGFLSPSARAWLIVPGVLAVLATAPSLRWSALAALTATSLIEPRRQRFAWLALFILALGNLFVLLVAQPWSPRAQVVAFAGSLLLLLVAAAGTRSGVLALAAFALVILQNTSATSAFLMTRFGWVASAGALLLVARALLDRHGGKTGIRIEDALLGGLLLLAVAAHDNLGLGIVASVLLLIAMVVTQATPDPADPGAGAWSRSLMLLARSGWPPTVRFAGVTLAAIAALQTSLAAGLLAALLLAGLKFSPLIEPAAAGEGKLTAARDWLAPAISLACGLAPALVLRMLRV